MTFKAFITLQIPLFILRRFLIPAHTNLYHPYYLRELLTIEGISFYIDIIHIVLLRCFYNVPSLLLLFRYLSLSLEDTLLNHIPIYSVLITLELFALEGMSCHIDIIHIVLLRCFYDKAFYYSSDTSLGP